MDDKLLVINCPLCGIFLNPRENIKTKLYWPESIDEVPESEFVILDYEPYGVPCIIYRDHVRYKIPKSST